MLPKSVIKFKNDTNNGVQMWSRIGIYMNNLLGKYEDKKGYQMVAFNLFMPLSSWT